MSFSSSLFDWILSDLSSSSCSTSSKLDISSFFFGSFWEGVFKLSLSYVLISQLISVGKDLGLVNLEEEGELFPLDWEEFVAMELGMVNGLVNALSGKGRLSS